VPITVLPQPDGWRSQPVLSRWVWRNVSAGLTGAGAQASGSSRALGIGTGVAFGDQHNALPADTAEWPLALHGF